jgi:hypothetical protein
MNTTTRQFVMIKTLILLALTSMLAYPALAQQATEPPIPSGTEIVIWLRASQVAQDPALKSALLDNNAVGNYLTLMDLNLDQIDRVVMFMPFDKAWVNGTRLLLPNSLPKNAAMIINGNFEGGNQFRGLKSKGWKEQKYSNKKLLWWSTGSNYYVDPQSGRSVSPLPGGAILAGGSEEIVKRVLDVTGGKTEGIQNNITYQRLSQDFGGDNTKLFSAYVLVTPEMRNLIKADTIAIRSSTGRAAIGYIDYLDEAGVSASKSSNGYVINGYLGMDSESNSLVVSSIFQIGGGLASFLPPNDPNRSALENLNVDRNGKLVILQSNLTQQQLLGLLRHQK